MDSSFSTLIISDIHLGVPGSQVKNLLSFLKKIKVSRLILLGDIFDMVNFSHLNVHEWELLTYFKKLGEKDSGTEVIWISGNHDRELLFLSPFLGISIHAEYIWKENGITFMALHGDQFSTSKKWFSYFFFFIYRKIIFFDKSGTIPPFIKKYIWLWKNISKKMIERALSYAREKNITHIICGHSHYEMHYKKDGISYWNSGTWLENPAAYILIEKGIPKLLFSKNGEINGEIENKN